MIMSILFLALAFISVTAGAFFLEKHSASPLKRYSFICSISCIAVFTYLTTFAVSYFYAQYLVYAASLAILGLEGIKHKFLNFKKFCKEHCSFFILSLVWFILTIQAKIFQWDDFSWGSFVKHLNHFGTYWNSNAAILEQGLRYFPGISLWENFFIGQDIYNEQALFFGLGLVSVAAFHACLPKALGSKNTFYFCVLFFAPVSWFTSGYGNISSETMMGMLLGTALCAAFDAKDPKDLFIPFSMAIFLAITKETGFLLALLIVLLIVVRLIRKKVFFSKHLVFCLICLAIMLINFKLWQIYLKKDPALQTFNSDGILDLFKQDIAHASLRTKETLTSFFQALYNRPLGRSYLSRIPLPFFEYIKGFYYFWVLALAAVLYFVKNKYEYFVTFFWGLFGYTFVLIITFLYFFGEYEGRILASYERYMGVYFLAFAILAIKIMYEEKLFQKKFFLYTVATLIIIAPPSPKIFYPASIKHLIAKILPEKYQHKINKDVRVELIPILNKITENTPLDSKVWLIWQNTTGYEAMILRYEIAPRKMNVGWWSLGDKYYEGDVWTVNYSKADLLVRLQGYDFMALGFVDDKFVTKFGDLFTSLPKSGSLYKKEIINNETRLAVVE